jgi:hypothetical protein
MIIAGGFLWWGFNTLFITMPTFWWWTGFIWLAIGIGIISSQIYALANRSKLRTIVKQEFMAKPNITVEEIAMNTGISRKDVKAIILDLKANGELRGKFSSKTGEAKHIEIKSEVQLEQQPKDAPKGVYCPNCGTPVSKDAAMYCAYCGAKL